MNSIDFSKLGGYPLAQEDLDFLQQSYTNAFNALALLCGNDTIIAGMEEAAGNVSAGWIVKDGEILPFMAGAIGTGKFIIEETAAALTFQDGNDKDVLITRVARFSSGGPYDYADLTRLLSLANVWRPGDVKERICDQAYVDANFDVDGYGMGVEKGWRILSKAYPDTAGKFFVNYDEADADFNVVGETGGAKTVTLQPANLPVLSSSNHGLVNRNGVNTFTGGDSSGGEFDNKDMVNWPGTGEPVNKMPPFYVILKLVKL